MYKETGRVEGRGLLVRRFPSLDWRCLPAENLFHQTNANVAHMGIGNTNLLASFDHELVFRPENGPEYPSALNLRISSSGRVSLASYAAKTSLI